MRRKIGQHVFLSWRKLNLFKGGIVSMIRVDAGHGDIGQDRRIVVSKDDADAIQMCVAADYSDDIVLIVGHNTHECVFDLLSIISLKEDCA